MTNVRNIRPTAEPNEHLVEGSKQVQADTFDDFWRNYPKRVGKALARVKWTAITGPGLETKTYDPDSNSYVPIKLKATPAELLEAAKAYRKSQIDPNTYKLRDDGRWTCQPATWLNKGRFEDEL